MPISRSPSFGDDDLELISSQTANMALDDNYNNDHSPLQSINNHLNHSIIDLSSSPASKPAPAPAPAPAQATNVPTFGRPTQMHSPLHAPHRKEPNIFIPRKKTGQQQQQQQRNHHDLYRSSGPLKPRAEPKKAPLPVFSSVADEARSSVPANQYYGQPTGAGAGVGTAGAAGASGAAYGDQMFYTDPARASEDLKALLEGGMDEEDEDEDGEDKKEKRDATKKEKKEGGAEGEGAGEEEEEEEEIDDGTFEGISVKLLPHQVEGVTWMRAREVGPIKRGKLPKGGILADDMGLGKTLQTIALIVGSRKPEREGDAGWKKGMERVSKTTLVVAPLALIRQWEAEIRDKVSPESALDVYVHHGPQRTRDPRALRRHDVVITTYQILVSEHGDGRGSSGDPDDPSAGCFGVHWFRVVLDEAHSIKNRNAKATKACCSLRAEYRWCLTGTPMQNNLDELQSLVHFLRIQPYDDLPQWRAHIDGPFKSGKGHVAIRRLHTVLRCFMKRRTKDILREEGALVAGGKKALDAAKARAEKKKAARIINNNNNSEEQVEDGDDDDDKSAVGKPAFRVTERRVVTVAAEFSPAERLFYDALETRADASLKRMMRGQRGVNYANALVLLLRLRQACNHPRLAESKLDKDRDALATDSQQSQSQRGRGRPKKGAVEDSDVDALADALGGMGIQTRQCDMCLGDLSRQEVADGLVRCVACSESVEKFKGETAERKKVKHKGRRVSEVREQIKVEKKKKKKKAVKAEPKPKPKQNTRSKRRIITDSDDEDDDNDGADVKKIDEEDEEEGSWLVPEEERGSLRLEGDGDDEDAEGTGEDIGPDDSEDDEEEDEDDTRLSSFVVDDEKAKREGDDSDEGDSDSDGSDETFVSISKLHTQVVSRHSSQKKDDSEEEDDDDDDDETASDQSISQSEIASDSDSEDDNAPPPSRRPTHIHRRGFTKPTHDDDDDDDDDDDRVMMSAKVRELIAIIGKEVAEHKFIVFSQFTTMLDLVEPFFRREKGFKSVRYDGKMANDAREAALHALRNDPHTRILLCSLKCGSLGLNLTAATRVVLVEPFWNPFVEEQAIDRVHRLTQTVDVVVYKLTVAGTVEERILDLQNKKRLLAEAAIEGGMRKKDKKDGLKLGLQEILELFRHDAQTRDARDVYQSGDTLSDPRAVAQDLAQFLRKKPQKAKEKESEVYGRRW